MTTVLAVLGAWRMMRALARIATVVVITSLALGYVSLARHGRPAPLIPLRHAVTPIERQLKITLEHAFKP
jgi:hypothetical protein